MSLILNMQGDLPNETFTATLDNIDYKFNVRWNSLDKAWFMLVGSLSEAASFKTKLTSGNNLLAPFKHLPECPKGDLFLVDMEGLFSRPDRNDTGQNKRFILFYYEVGELDAIQETV